MLFKAGRYLLLEKIIKLWILEFGFDPMVHGVVKTITYFPGICSWNTIRIFPAYEI